MQSALRLLLVSTLGLSFACQAAQQHEPRRTAASAASADKESAQAKRAGLKSDAKAHTGAAKAAWTQTFMTKGVLIADEVTIQGPTGLYEHLVIKQEPDFHLHALRTTEEGLRTEVALKPGVSEIEIRAFLDQLNIAALQRLVVLERPGQAAVVVEARGNAMLQMDGAAETRSSLLRLVGEAPR